MVQRGSMAGAGAGILRGRGTDRGTGTDDRGVHRAFLARWETDQGGLLKLSWPARKAWRPVTRVEPWAEWLSLAGSAVSEVGGGWMDFLST